MHQQRQLQRQYQIVPNAPQTGEAVIASSSLNVKAIRVLAIAQIVFGSIVIILGAAALGLSSTFRVSLTGSGIWYGGWILIAGMIGFFSARKPFSKSLNGTNMGFNIVCAVVSLVLVNVYSWSTMYFLFTKCTQSYNYSWCTNQQGNVGIYATLSVLTTAEFAVSLTISILCCKCACCGAECCCQSSTESTTQQPVSYLIVTTNTGDQVVLPTNTQYPQVAFNGELPASNSCAPVFQSYPMPNQMIVSNQPGIITQPGIVMQPPQQSHKIGQRKIAQTNQSTIHPTLATLQQPNSGVITNNTLQGATANDESQMNGESIPYYTIDEPEKDEHPPPYRFSKD